MLEFEVVNNGIIWRNPSGRYLGWFDTWQQAILVIATLRHDVKFRIVSSDVIYLPR